MKQGIEGKLEPRFEGRPELLQRSDIPQTMERDVKRYESRFDLRFENFAYFRRGGLRWLHAADAELDARIESRVLDRPPFPTVASDIDVLTRVANSTEIANHERLEYVRALTSIYRKLPSNPQLHRQDGSVLFVGVEREGRILAEALGCLPEGHSLRPHAKRIPHNKGLLVGVRGLRPERLYESCTIIDGAIASGATLITMMMELAENTRSFHIFSAHATWEGVRGLVRFAGASDLSIRITVGHLTAGIDSHFYAVLSDDTSKLVVGDLGDTIWPVHDRITHTEPVDRSPQEAFVSVGKASLRPDIEWQRRRATLNHDWLKNRLLVGLAEWINVMDELIEDDDHARTFINVVLPEWPVQRDVFQEMLDGCEAAMSPRHLVTGGPLRGMPAADQVWLLPVIHELWVLRSGVRRLTVAARESLADADADFQRIAGRLSSERSSATDSWQDVRPTFGSFQAKCIALGNAVEQLRSVDLLSA